MQTFKKILTVVVLVAVLAAIAIVIDLYKTGGVSGVKYSSTNTPTQYLSQNNAAFEQALVAQSQQNYTVAKQDYQLALQSATDPVQKAQIQYAIASMTEEGGDYADAITMYKAIAADTSNYTFVRAYAVQQIGLINYMYFNTNKKALVQETFSSYPYSKFYATSSVSLSYKNLFQYAASIYPLGQSEARVAYWYAGYIAKTLHSTTSAEGQADLAVVEQDIAAANTDNARAVQDPASQRMVPSTYMFEGLSYALLVPLGAASSSEAENAFNQAVTLSTSLGYAGYERFYYAEYLLGTYGTKRAADIESLIAPFTTSNTAMIDPPVATFFAAARNKTVYYNTNPALIQFAKLQPSFKTYLLSLGWKQSDFSGSGN